MLGNTTNILEKCYGPSFDRMGFGWILVPSMSHSRMDHDSVHSQLTKWFSYMGKGKQEPHLTRFRLPTIGVDLKKRCHFMHHDPFAMMSIHTASPSSNADQTNFYGSHKKTKGIQGTASFFLKKKKLIEQLGVISGHGNLELP